MAAHDFVSDNQFARAKAGLDMVSPSRTVVTHSDKFHAEQFAGSIGSPDVPTGARRAHYIGDQSVHQWRTSPGDNDTRSASG